MNKRRYKKKMKRAFWKSATAYELFGGEISCWGKNPIIEIYCSHCGANAPVQKGHEEDFNTAQYTIYKKKCPSCGYRMR